MNKHIASGRVFPRIRKIAHTMAHLEDPEDLAIYHITEAIQQRSLDLWGLLHCTQWELDNPQRELGGAKYEMLRTKNEKIFLSQSPQGSQRRQKYRIQVSGIWIQAMTPVSFSPLCEPCDL